MKAVKTAITLLLAVGIVYLAVLIVMSVILYQQRDRIGEQIRTALAVDSVSIREFFSLPLLFVELRNVRVNDERLGRLDVERLALYYNPWTAVTRGFEKSIYRADVRFARVRADLSSLSRWTSRLDALTNAGTNVALPASFRLSLRNTRLEIGVFGDARVDILIDRAVVGLRRKLLDVRAVFRIDSHLSNLVDYLQAAGELNFVRNLTNGTGSGVIQLSNVRSGPLTIAEQDRIPFTMTNGLYADYVSPDGSVTFRANPSDWTASVLKSFRVTARRFEERSFLEYVLTPGFYHLVLTGAAKPAGISLKAGIQDVSNARKIPLDFSYVDRRGRLDFLLRVDSAKFGVLNARLSRERGNAFPEGTVALRDLFVLDGLRLGGFAVLTGGRKSGFLSISDIRLNGGPLGSAATKMTLQPGGLELSLPGTGYNESVQGIIRPDGFEITADVQGVSGAAVVSNIIFDFMGISKASVSGRMTVKSDPERIFTIAASAIATLKAPDGSLKKFAETRLEFSAADLSLTFRDLYFPLSRLNYNGTFVFRIFDRPTGRIDFDGSVNYLRHYDSPLTGQILFDNRMLTSAVEFTLDNGVFLQVTGATNAVSLSLSADNYPLSRWGADGRLTADIRAGWTLSRINSFLVRGRYEAFGETVLVSARAARDSGGLRLQQFLIDNRDDRLVGTGKVWQDGNRLNAEIGFIRGGEIRFSSSWDDIRGVIDIRNMFFRDFLGTPDRNVTLNGRLDCDGPLILPDAKGFLRIVNASNTARYLVDVPDIRKTGADITVRNAVYQDENVRADFQARWNPVDDGSVLAGDGTFNLLGTLRGRFAATYFTQTNQNSLSYDFRGLVLNNRFLRDYSGGVIFKNDRYTFFRKGDRGFSGYYLRKRDRQEWNLDLSDADIRGNFSGDIRGQQMRSDLQVTGELYLLSVLDVFRDMGGNGSLRFHAGGTLDNPVIDGDLRLYDAAFGIANTTTRVRGVNLNVPIRKNKMVFDRFRLNTSTGDFLVNGYVDIQNFSTPNIHLALSPAEKKLPVLGINYLSPNFRVTGEFAVSNASLSGTPSALYLEGLATAENCTVEMPSITPPDSQPLPDWFANIRWNVPVRIGNSVKFANEFVDAFLRKDDSLWIQGSFADGTFTVKGRTGVERGTLTYLGRDFIIREGTANFYGSSGDPLPYVVLVSTTTYRDEKNEDVEVYLTFEGKVSTITVRDFYSVPSKSRSELAAVLGLSIGGTGGTNESTVRSAQELFVSGVSAAQNFYFFNPLGTDLRRRLGLDLFTFRTGIIETWARRTVAGDTNIDPLSFFEGTSLIVGKYVFPNVFVQYEMTLARDPFSELELVPLHTVGVELDLRAFDLGWKYKPITEVGRGIKYEQRFELNFNRQF